MSAATVSAANYSDTKKPQGIVGYYEEYTAPTIATTSLDDVGDRVRLFKVKNGTIINKLIIGNHDDLDSGGGGALDMDVVLVDDAGDTILYNAGTAFNAATTTPLIVLPGNITVVDTVGAAYVGLKVNVAASTAQAGAVPITLGFYP